VQNLGPVVSKTGLDKHGISNYAVAYWNLPPADLYEHAILNMEAELSDGGAIVATTGEYTGRSPKDKFIVEEADSKDNIWWGDVNKSFSPEKFELIRQKMLAYMQGGEFYVQDLYGGTDENYRLPVRIITEQAWHNLFASNMFVRPPMEERADFDPQFTVIQCPGFQAIPEIDGTNSEAFILLSLKERQILIGGTQYAGEIKKSIFGVLNYLLPAQNVMPMHCSANDGDGGSAVFFGLSGTGKTTLSADSSRTLIGDDEHGWSDDGIFNFEGGCYAKAINLTAEAEPEIFATTRMFRTVLENVVIDPATRVPDYTDTSLAENTRVSYPIESIPNSSKTGKTGHPTNLIMLTADAFGVLPPVSKLTADQAMYHFLSGYTSKVAGTERGITEPQSAFSACFGAPFMPRHPSAYAKLLGEKIDKHNVNCWLVNTGWTGGAYGTGQRMILSYTRAMITAILNGSLSNVETAQDSVFGLHIPTSCPNVPDGVLMPRETWTDREGYDEMAKKLAGLFERNFKDYEGYVSDSVKAIAIRG
jgi:phosphoenolpyruvate carboxykinase (ATP)